MLPHPPRVVRLVLTASGALVGALPPYPVATPWWQDAHAVVQGARERFGLQVTVLRMLATELPAPQGGAVTYLAEAELDAPPPGVDYHARDPVAWLARTAAVVRSRSC
ncbi:hypothetical protein predicted by Glimmer/Critica [Sorangium cellulosum So ce56]|uniref:Uncharacterized protein n=1 Tax=Sorangium cellulosum (strain So ce56) TaxID=448385 RepID=A9ENN2_SORC5|nr:hypothetical protein [Sorangium cellulosum]CAN90879.1 hypothetical protein predicted by Glimmer/Critica [Sorangium cellulosum So ce56]